MGYIFYLSAQNNKTSKFVERFFSLKEKKGFLQDGVFNKWGFVHCFLICFEDTEQYNCAKE